MAPAAAVDAPSSPPGSFSWHQPDFFIRKIINAKATIRAIPAMPPNMPPTTSLVCVLVPLPEDPEAATLALEEELPADAVDAVDAIDAPDPSLPPALYVAEAESDAENHPVDAESENVPDEETENAAEVVELANVVERKVEEPDTNDDWLETVEIEELVCEVNDSGDGDETYGEEVIDEDRDANFQS